MFRLVPEISFIYVVWVRVDTMARGKNKNKSIMMEPKKIKVTLKNSEIFLEGHLETLQRLVNRGADSAFLEHHILISANGIDVQVPSKWASDMCSPRIFNAIATTSGSDGDGASCPITSHP